MGKKKSAILDAVHDTAKGLHNAGVIDQVTLREFDRLCLRGCFKRVEVGTKGHLGE
jgi:DNA-binding transcriptional regulator YiaG